MKSKKGISLIVLIVMIVVMIILGSAIILNLSEGSNPMEESKRATVQTDIDSFRDEFYLYLSKNPRVDSNDVNVGLEDYDENGTIDINDLEIKRIKMKKYIPSIDRAKIEGEILYADILTIQNGELKLHNDDNLNTIYTIIATSELSSNSKRSVLNIISQEEENEETSNEEEDEEEQNIAE